MRRFLLAGAFVLPLLGTAASVWWFLAERSGPVTVIPPPGRGILAGTPEIGGPFILVDQDGREVTEATFRGKYLLVFFGFTSCPDICPLSLDRFAEVLDLLGRDAEAVQPLLISVDPERDTPAALKDYVASFHPKILGLTGSIEQVRAAASRYKVYFAKDAPSGQNYSVSHSAYEYLMGPDGNNLQIFRSEYVPHKVADVIRQHIRGAL